MRLHSPKRAPINEYKWHPWFAWRPIRIDDQLVWLETIERKRCHRFDLGFYEWWEYRNYEQTS